MTPDQITTAAEQLFQAEQTGQQIGLLSLQYPQMTMDHAYDVQAALVQRKLQAGRRVIGWKIGLTSRAMQMALNIDIPDSGVLLDDMQFENGATIPAGRFIQPRIEAEIAFVFKSDLAGENISVVDVINATDYICPALEILDTRILRADPETGQARNVNDTISDNAANAGIVLGGSPVRPDALDMRRIGAIVSRNAQVEETGLGAGVLNHPAQGIVWLAERLATYGQSIRRGEVVISGSFIRPVEAPSGSTIFADFGDFGTVSVFFE
jgi:2-oxo-hept-3-ene-1,7-dioate hydratase